MKQGKRVLVAAGVVMGFVAARVAWAHPGRTNSSGCHNNRRTGDYHCHGGGSYSGGWSAPAAEPTRLQVVAIPRARVWINDQFVGLSPTRAIKVDSGKVKVRLEHVALGAHEVTATVTAGETTALTVRW
ncbi:YHYH domain-containing protein [Myxococcus sp. RHSTA-1-4]|uniref:YHYH domain-containing protein n=1 Tax=Myxococcus sp. RHSTA-1-4 TaxID=2874601 RepID=UPI001CBB52A2|nr:YHYH domain-containing protein [Myxococcus sp. RHSTA-1-4]MBZ4417089.1 YHYH domain-containing protein [Myxococcus sp. RHSTA-1-4]